MSLSIEFTSTLPATAAAVAVPAATPEPAPVPEAGPEVDDTDLRIPFASSILLKDFAYWQHHAYWFRKDLYQVLDDALALLAEKYPIPADEPMPADLQDSLEAKRAIALAKQAALTRRNKRR
jgi:hypothetical protein